jgi:hypothetical protein
MEAVLIIDHKHQQEIGNGICLQNNLNGQSITTDILFMLCAQPTSQERYSSHNEL